MIDNQELNETQEDKSSIHTRLTPETYKKFKAVCALNGKSMTQCVNELVDDFLSENKLIV